MKISKEDIRWLKVAGLVFIALVIGIFIGAIMISWAGNKVMEGYDLYACVYNNAARNSFNKHPVMIRKIQDECVCFRENNYTNLLEVDCTT